MYCNNTLIKLDVESGTDNFGYCENKFTETNKIFKADVQPYSSQLLKKEYGLEESNVVYRCFLSQKGLKTGDYVKVNDSILQTILVHEWENHTELVLGGNKNGKS